MKQTEPILSPSWFFSNDKLNVVTEDVEKNNEEVNVTTADVNDGSILESYD